MKFISKNSNLRVILTPSIQAEPLAGRAAIRGLFVKFEDGVANVVDEEIISLMLKHPAFNVDFINAEEGKDPFVRRSVEPEHNIVDIKFGHVGKNKNPATAMTGLTPELKKVLSDMAKSMASEMTKQALAELAPKLKDEIVAGMKRGAAHPEETMPALSSVGAEGDESAEVLPPNKPKTFAFGDNPTPSAPKKGGRPSKKS
jgi:hypothetical protein